LGKRYDFGSMACKPEKSFVVEKIGKDEEIESPWTIAFLHNKIREVQ